MAERYTRLFSLPENLYTEGAPVLVAAGALLRDNMTDTVLAQLKLKNIGEGEICAVTVLVNSFDPAGRPLGEPVRHSCLDLCAKRDGEFGQKNLAALPDKTARSYTVAVTEVVFWDGRVWTGTDTPWKPFDKQKTLAEALGDIQLAEQYGIEVGAVYELAPIEQSDLWLCACGGVNRESEPVCHSCRLKKESAFGALDKETLKTKLSARLAEEAAEAERKRLEEEKRRKEQERNAELARLERAEKAKKLGKGALIVLSAAIVCAAVVLLATKVVIPTAKYNNAVELMESGEYEEAVAAFEALEGYKDSEEQIIACEIAIKDLDYAAAVELMESGEYEEAIVAFKTLEGYKDSEEQISDILSKNPKLKYKVANIGDIVTFGAYEQDNNISNGKEDIEWRVLAWEYNRILVISEKALDCQQYNTSWTDVTWETCSLRKWMNGTFLDEAFSAEDQAIIESTTASADKNPEYSIDPGNATTDKVFLLSITEAEKYFTADSARQCKPTEFAVANGAHVDSGNGNCWWWLRSPGSLRSHAAHINYGGSVLCDGNDVFNNFVCVRPAMWINLDS